MLLIPSLLRADELGAVLRRGDSYRSSALDLELVRVRPGVYAPVPEWDAARPEARAVARARALVLTSSTPPPVISHETAAAAHALPLYRPDRSRVHLSLDERRPGAAVGTIRHRAADLRPGEVVEIGGLVVTSLTRTIADVARTATFEQAVVIADAALRKVALLSANEYDSERAAQFCDEARVIAARSAHGVRRAERVLAFADGRAQLPGESISRIRLNELGFRRIRLQVAFPGPHGRMYYADFVCDEPGEGWLGEFDGKVKYADEGMRAGRTADVVFDDEKQREDWLRGVSQRPMARWGWSHLDTAMTLGRRLWAFGIRPPR